MGDLIKIEVKSVPASLSFNFDAIKARLTKYLADYDVLVTEDTLADSKKLATEINSLTKSISDKRKEVVGEISAPIKKFELLMKELEELSKECRSKIIEQVAVFDKAVIDKANAALIEERDEQYQVLGVAEEFRLASIAGMAKQSTLTGTGKLTAAAKRDVLAVVTECKNAQLVVERRLANLEMAGMKAGLVAPLTRDHVEGFLKHKDEIVYAAQLEKIIASELDRQRVVQKAEQDRVAAQAAALVEKPVEMPTTHETPVMQTNVAPIRQAPTQQFQPEETNAQDGRSDYWITAHFLVTAKTGYPADKMEANFRKAIVETAGMTTLKQVQISVADKVGNF